MPKFRYATACINCNHGVDNGFGDGIYCYKHNRSDIYYYVVCEDFKRENYGEDLPE